MNGIGLSNSFYGAASLAYSNLPYVLAEFSVASGATLTLPAGQVLKFLPSVKMNVAGTLQAVGTSQNPIVFTSLKDDAAGGDTNNDGSTSPAPGDWLGLYFGATSSGSLLEHTVLRYAGRPYVLTHHDSSISSYCGGESTYTGIYVDGGALTLRSSTLEQLNGTGLNVYHGSAVLENSLIHQIKSGEYVPGTGCNVIWYGYGVYGATATLTATGSTIQNNGGDGLRLTSSSTATLTDNVFTGNRGYAVQLSGALLSAQSGSNQASGNAVNGIGLSNTFYGAASLAYSNLPYVLSELGVASGATLTLPAGQVLKFRPGIKVSVAGSLQAVGTSQNPIVFTTLTDDTAGGDTNNDDAATAPALGEWSGLYFASTSTGSVLDNVRLRYAGKPYNLTHKDSAVSSGCGSLSTWSSIYVDQGSITLKNSQLMRGNGVAVNVYKGTAVVDNNLISLFFSGGTTGACGVTYPGSAIYSDQAALTVTNNWLTFNNYGIKILSVLSAGISGNSITDNSDYGIYSVPVISAENNWWGEASGPAPFGRGNPINYDVCRDSQGKLYICSYHVRAYPWVGISRYYGKAQAYQAFVADPVNTASGNYYSHHTDLSIPTRSIPLAFTRSYNSIYPEDGPLGYGWAHSYHVSLSESPVDQSVTISFGDGHSERYTWDGAAYQPPAGVNTHLTRPGGVFTLTFKDQSKFVFEGSGRLAQITDRSGNTTTLTYSGTVLSTVSAPDGRTLAFSYLGSRVSRITDPLGRAVQFAYDASGNLSTVTDAANQITAYTYDANHRLLTVTDANGHTFVTNVYDADGRVIQQFDAKYNQTTFAYDIANHRTTVTDPLAHTTVYQYDANLRLTAQTDGLNHTTSFTYDAASNLLSKTDPNNHTTTFTYDARGNRLTTTDSLGGVTTHTYDAQNHLLSVTDALQHTTTYTYDASGSRLTETDPLNNVTTYTYYADPDYLGLLHTVTDALGRVTTYEYNAQGSPTRVTNALGQSTTATFDAGGRRLSRTDARGHTWTYTYDPLNRLLTETDPLDHVTTFAYDPVGNRVSVEDANHKITHSAYNEKDQLVTVTDPAGYVTAYTYDAVGNQRTVTDGNNHTTTYGYDAANRLVSVTNPLGQVTTYGYDPAGNQTTVTDPLNHTTTAYDALNRPVTIINALGHAAARTYDALGNILTSTDANGHVTHFTYTARGQLATVTDALGGIIRYTYDASGSRTSTQDANGHVTRYQYDALNRLVGTTNPLDQVTTRTYDENGSLLSLLDANGHTTTFQYDPLNRLLKTLFDDGAQVRCTYDAVGNLLEMVDALGTTTYTYDDRYRPLSVTGPTGALAYTYDAANRLTLTSPGGTVTHTYDAANRLLTVTDWQNQTTTYTYDAAGRHTATAYPNGVSAALTYDAADRPTGVREQKGEETLLEIQYTLDPAGNRLSMVDGDGVTTYTYDDLNRLRSVAYPGGAPSLVEYTYDATGNRLSLARDGVRTTYTYDAVDRLLSTTTAGVTTPYTWDANGNLLSRGSQTFTWDRANQLIRLEDGASTTTYQYDGSGARLGKTVNGVQTTYLPDPTGSLPSVVRETTGVETADYVYGLDLIAQTGAAWSYYHADALGSTRLLTNAAGEPTAAYTYDAFGATRAQTGASAQSFTFAGQQLDAETGLFFLRARYYDPADGRFISSDRYPSLASQTQTLNRYVYVQNNPVLLVDPTGNAWYDDALNWINQAASDIGNWIVENTDFLKNGAETVNHYQEAADAQAEMIRRIDEGYTGNYKESFNDLQRKRQSALREFAASEADFIMSMPCTSMKADCGLTDFIPNPTLVSIDNAFGVDSLDIEFKLKDLISFVKIGRAYYDDLDTNKFSAVKKIEDYLLGKGMKPVDDLIEGYPGNSIRYYYSQFGQAEGGYFGGPPSQNK